MGESKKIFPEGSQCMMMRGLGSRLSLLLVLLTFGIGAEQEGSQSIEPEDKVVYSVVVESCSGWRLNKLPEVKQFIQEDLETFFDRSTYKKIPGKSPEVVFYNQAEQELERLNVEKFSREELNQLMADRGIPAKKKTSHDEV